MPLSAETGDRGIQNPEGVRTLESALMQALHARDAGRIEALLAPDYVLRAAPDIDRATWIRQAMALCWGDRSDIDAFHSRRLGDVVVASFALTVYVHPDTCRPAVMRSLVTDVWVLADDGWRLKLRHAGAPPRGGADLAAQYGIEPAPPPRWQMNGEISAVATGGNTSTRTVGLGAELGHRLGDQQTNAVVRFLTSQADEVTNARSLTMQARHGWAFTARAQVFGEVSYARDRFAGIDDRGAAAAGLSYTTRLAEIHTLGVQAGLGMTVEQRLDATRLRFATANGAIDYGWRILPGTDFAETTTLNADLETGRNWRATSTTALNVALTELLSLRASHAIEYRNAPVAGFGRSDMRTAMTLVFSTARRGAVR